MNSKRRSSRTKPTNSRDVKSSINLDVQKEADRILSRYVPASVIINEDFQIIRSRGRTGRYVEPAPGQTALNLTEMTREGLVVDLRAAVLEAKRHNRPVKKRRVPVNRDGNMMDISLEVIPIKGSMPQSRYFLVLFKDTHSQAERADRKVMKAGAARPVMSKAAKDQITQMKQALTQSTQRYQFFFERSQAGVFYTHKGRVTECNDTFTRMLGYASPEEVLQTQSWDVHLNLEDQKRLYRRLLKERRIDNEEVLVKRRDGAAMWVQVSVDLLTPRETHPPSERDAVGIIVDITRRVQAESRLARLSSFLMKEADDRRRNLARELHDEIGSGLAGLSASLSALERAPGLEKKVRTGISKCLKQVKDCTVEVQTVCYLQHPLVIDDLGLAAAVRWCAKDFSKRAGVKVETEIADSVMRLPEETEIALYRIIQECLTNVQRYSGSPAARVRIDKTDRDLIVEVCDFGKGIAPCQEGMGIIGMRERMKELGGRLGIKGVKDKGTTVTAFLPLASIKG